MPNALKILHLVGYSIYLFCTAVARLFPLTFVFFAGRCLGAAGCVLLRNRRRLAVTNLMLALDKTEEEARVLVREHFKNLGANMLSALKLATMSDAQILKRVTIDIPPEIYRLQKEQPQKGWVAMISHMGNWELLSHLSPLFPQYKYGAVYQKLANHYVDRHFKESRARSGVTLFDRREGYWKCLTFLREGGSVGVLVDQYAGMPGTWMPFFRRLTSTSPLAATMAIRTDVSVVPIAVYTTGLARWRFTVSLPLEKEDDVEKLTAKINRELERQIAASPADWLWSHNRWKTPRWVFLFTLAKQRVYFPPGFNRGTLIPYRILVRSVDDLEEAKISLRAVQAIKRGRPDLHLTMVAGGAAADFWKTVAEVDEVIVAGPGESVWAVAKKIKNAGRFDVGILLAPMRRVALEAYLGGVPYRIGAPRRFLLNNWENPPGRSDPPERGAERYRRIAEAAGAVAD